MSRFSRWQEANRKLEQQQAIAQTIRPRILLPLMELNRAIFDQNLLHGSRFGLEYMVHFYAQRIVALTHTGRNVVREWNRQKHRRRNRNYIERHGFLLYEITRERSPDNSN